MTTPVVIMNFEKKLRAEMSNNSKQRIPMKKLIIMLALAGLAAGCSHTHQNSGSPSYGATGGTWDTITLTNNSAMGASSTGTETMQGPSETDNPGCCEDMDGCDSDD